MPPSKDGLRKENHITIMSIIPSRRYVPNQFLARGVTLHPIPVSMPMLYCVSFQLPGNHRSCFAIISAGHHYFMIGKGSWIHLCDFLPCTAYGLPRITVQDCWIGSFVRLSLGSLCWWWCFLLLCLRARGDAWVSGGPCPSFLVGEIIDKFQLRQLTPAPSPWAQEHGDLRTMMQIQNGFVFSGGRRPLDHLIETSGKIMTYDSLLVCLPVA